MRLARLALLLGLFSPVARAQGPTATDWASSVSDAYHPGGDAKATCPAATGNLNAVHGRGRPDVPKLTSGEVWAVGDNGKIIYYDGISGSWVTQASGVTAHLRAVYIYPWDLNAGGALVSGWACGDGGTLLKLTHTGGFYAWNIANNPAGACSSTAFGGPMHVCADMLAIFPADSSTAMTHLFITGAAMCNPPDLPPYPTFGANPLLLNLNTSSTVWSVVNPASSPYRTFPPLGANPGCTQQKAYVGLITDASGPPASPATEGFVLDSLNTNRNHWNLVGTGWNPGNGVLTESCPSSPLPAYYGAARIGANIIVVGDTDPGSAGGCNPCPPQLVAPNALVPANVFTYDQYAPGAEMYSLGTGINGSPASYGTLRSLHWLSAWGFGVSVGHGVAGGADYAAVNSGGAPDAYFALFNAPDSLKYFVQDDPTSQNTVQYWQRPGGTTWAKLNGVFLSKANEGWAVGATDSSTSKGTLLHWTGPTVTAPNLVVSLTNSPFGALLPNSLVEIVLTVTNTGGTGVVNFNATLPAPAQVFAADQPPGVPFCGSTTYSCPTTLAPGASASFTWTFSTTACTTGVTFVGTAGGDNVVSGNPVTSSTPLSFGSAGVTLTATLYLNRGQLPPSPSQPAQYEVFVRNAGSAPLTSLMVVDTLPSIITPSSFYQPAGFGPPAVTTNAGGGRIIAWSSTNSALAAGGVWSFTVTGSVLAACQSQEISATAWAWGADICLNAAQQRAGNAAFTVTGPMTAAMYLNRATEQIPGRYLLELVLTVSDTGLGCIKPLIPAPSLTVIPAGPETILQSSPMSGTCDAVASLPAGICNIEPCSRSFTWTYLNTAAQPVTFLATATATVYTAPCGPAVPCADAATGNQCLATGQVTVTIFSDAGEPGAITLNRNLFRPVGLNQTLTISFNVKESGEVSLNVYNSIGQRVRSLFKRTAVRRQQYDITWDGTNDVGERVSSGAYFVRLESTRYVITKKVALIK